MTVHTSLGHLDGSAAAFVGQRDLYSPRHVHEASHPVPALRRDCHGRHRAIPHVQQERHHMPHRPRGHTRADGLSTDHGRFIPGDILASDVWNIPFLLCLTPQPCVSPGCCHEPWSQQPEAERRRPSAWTHHRRLRSKHWVGGLSGSLCDRLRPLDRVRSRVGLHRMRRRGAALLLAPSGRSTAGVWRKCGRSTQGVWRVCPTCTGPHAPDIPASWSFNSHVLHTCTCTAHSPNLLTLILDLTCSWCQ